MRVGSKGGGNFIRSWILSLGFKITNIKRMQRKKIYFDLIMAQQDFASLKYKMD